MSIQIPADYKLPQGTTAAMRDFLQNQTDSFGTFFNLDRILYHQARYSYLAAKDLPELRAIVGMPSLKLTERATVLYALQSKLQIPDIKLLDRDNKLSTRKDVIEALVKDPDLNEDQHRFVELYQKASAADYMARYLGQYAQLPLSKSLDCDNNRMVIAHPKWSLLSTSRMSGSEPSVQNINRDVCDIYTSPKGWQMVFSDSGQIEPRITYSAFIRDELIKNLIIAYDDAYFGLLHYILLRPDEEQALRAGAPIVCHEITKEMKDKRQRLKVLGLAGNYGSTNLDAIDPELGPLYASKIVNHPLRRGWERQVAEEVRHGADHFYGYFGTPVYPEGAKRQSVGDSWWHGHMVRCGLNNPIQTTASELMMISLMNVKEILQPNEHVAMYKHDEGMFYIPEDKVDDRVEVFHGMLSYHVDGWIPIGSDLHIGRKESPYVKDLF